MIQQLLKHIRALSDSRLSHTNALEIFAHCFHTVYGECSFISLERSEQDDVYRIRMIFRAGEPAQSQLESHFELDRFQ